MSKIHKLLEQHRPQKLNTKPLMFQNIRTRITHLNSDKSDDQTPRQNVHRPSKELFTQQDNKKLQVQKHNHQRNDSIVSNDPKRLKLKDYLRLAQISRQKRSNSSTSTFKKISAKRIQLQTQNQFKITSQSQSNIKENQHKNLFVTFDPRQTFGPQGTIRKKTQRMRHSFQQELQIQKSQVLNLSIKTKQKFSKITQLIDKTNHKLQNYNDLVFMFRIEQIINQYIIKGIQKINDMYTDHFFIDDKPNNLNQVQDQNTIRAFQLLSIIIKKQSNCKSPALKAHQRIKELQKTNKENTKLKILPVSSPFLTVSEFREQ